MCVCVCVCVCLDTWQTVKYLRSTVTHLRMMNAACFRRARSFLARNIRTTLSILTAASRRQIYTGTHTHTTQGGAKNTASVGHSHSHKGADVIKVLNTL